VKKSDMKKELIEKLKAIRNKQEKVMNRELNLHFKNLEVELMKSLCILGSWEPEDE